MRPISRPLVCCCAGAFLAACESAPSPAASDSQSPFTTTEGLPPPAVVMEAVTTFPEGSIVTAATGEKVFHVVTEVKQPREYWVMLGPVSTGGAPSRGQLTNVPQEITDAMGTETYLAPAWDVVGGYARLFGWFPIATADQVVAGGIGTSFIMQLIVPSSGNSIVRVFLVNKQGTDAVEVSHLDQDGEPDATVIVDDQNMYAQYADGQLTLETLPESGPIREFVAWVESRAAANGLP